MEEIGLWCGLGRGKRWNIITEDRTGFKSQIGTEERLGCRDRIGNRVQVGVTTLKQGIDINKRVFRTVGFPRILEEVFHRQNGTAPGCFCVLGRKGTS